MDTQKEDVLDLLEGRDGRWFPLKGKAEVLVRRVPREKLKEIEVQTYGRVISFQPGGGSKIERSKVEKFTNRKAVFALLDSRNVEIPRDVLVGTPLEHGEGKSVLLDGQWSDAVKEAVFAVTGLAGVVAGFTDKLSEIADQEEADDEMGKA